jgi:hypothetical protein
VGMVTGTVIAVTPGARVTVPSTIAQGVA